ncbi:fumarylacetoacetate hydrolase family protein [Streptomyces sp. KL116D]|uniref:fumarylacetoacetate hydrolase family protein n=1 Tax=Streptomyces sp. KL116D TaxID=3045152 RepID=UPI0035586E23
MIPLLPGDVVFSGTPAGVGLGRDPQRWLAPATRLVSTIEGIGEDSASASSHRPDLRSAPATGPPFRPAGR